jgi:DNA-binding beta-propeller fold protein YncE
MATTDTTSANTTSGPPALEYVKTIGIVNNGDNGRGFTNPYDIAVSREGNIHVLNRCDPARAAGIRIGICNLEEEYLGEFGSGFGQGDGQFVWPVAIAFDRQERLYVTDEANHRITVFDAEGKFASKWGNHGSEPGQLDGPAGIAIDPDDIVYLVDQKNARIQKFTVDGEHLGGWGQFGTDPGQFNLPWGLALGPDGAVYVADWRNDRVQKFSPDGEPLAIFGATGDGDSRLDRPAGVAVDAEGLVYVADWGSERLKVYSPDGAQIANLRGQGTLSKWAMEFFEANPDEWETRQRSNLIPDLPEHLRSPYHESSQTEPYFWGPVSVRLDGQGHVYVTEAARHRFQVYRKP